MKRISKYERTAENDIKYRGPLNYKHLLILGWLGIYLVCLYHTDKRKSLFRQMSKEDVLLRINDPENLILVYLVLKAVVVVLGHFFAALTDLSLLMRYFN